MQEGKIIFLLVDKNANFKRAEEIAENLDLKIITDESEIDRSKLILQLDKDGLSLISNNIVLKNDFVKIVNRIKQKNLQNELLIHAAKIKNKKENMVAIDATAGLGEDSFLLAANGFYVHLYENNQIIAEMLQDTLESAKNIPELLDAVNRMELHKEDSIQAMRKIKFTPDVVLLDPMFPERTKSALIKKKFQLLHTLENPCNNETELLEAAISTNSHKIIIKRPLKGKYLANKKPSYSIKGNSIRYDCIVI